VLRVLGINFEKNRITSVLAMKEITAVELKEKLDKNEDLQLIDVREINERNFAHIGGVHIPMVSVLQNVDKFNKEKEVVVYCRSGNRSAQVIRFLEANHGFKNLANLKGGILAWSDEVDGSVPKY